MTATPREATGKAAAEALPTKDIILEARKKFVGYNVAVNYSKLPLYIVRGKAQYLYDETGAEYLDCVNNVCHVGHCHPAVVEAGCEQLTDLNTNSRYLSPFIIEYARRLTATLPSPLSVVFWVNSGSEANDLALRLARAHSKKRGVITVGGAYHGHVLSLIDISPYKYAREGGTGKRPWVREAPIPDVYSGLHRGTTSDESLGAAYAAEVDKCIASFQRSAEREKARKAAALARKAARDAAAAGGGAGADESDSDLDDDGLTAGCGAFIMESLLSCGGQVMPPAGYLRRVYASVRAAGGVCIADEVQVGFGRVGSHMWAFQLQGDDVIPDILTLGKPLGNGYPVAMVVTTPEVARSFASGGMEYFNTFGGNPVAGRVALATLDVLQKERLQENAAKVGAVLVEGFNGLARKYPFIGSVRGIGLMVGIEMIKPVAASAGGVSPSASTVTTGTSASPVSSGSTATASPLSTDAATPTATGGAGVSPAAVASDSPVGFIGDRVPWAEAASAVVYAMRKRRILLSTDGMDYNVIKMKPPMVFSEENARRVIAEMDEVMGKLGEAIEAYHAL